jgi:Tfp pilus assembly protein PilN
VSTSILISALGLALSLLMSVGGGLAIVWRVSALVTTLLATNGEMRREIEELKGLRGQISELPLLKQRIEQVEEDHTEQRRKTSDYPKMREKFESLSDAVERADLNQIRERLAVVERFQSTRGMPAVRPPRPENK